VRRRRCVVTGAGSGIGAAVARSFREDGEEVLGVDLAGADIDADLAGQSGREAAVAEIATRYDAVDVVVACAGSARPVPETVSVNFFGVVRLLEGLLPRLWRAERPRVVVITSVAAVHRALRSVVEACLTGDEHAAVTEARRAVDTGKAAGIYTSSKQALARWVRRSAPTSQWAGNGVTLNAVGPGVVLTPMIEDQWRDPVGRKALTEQVPMPLTGEPVDVGQIVRAVRFLAAPDNEAITGQCLYVDAGADATLRTDSCW